MVSKKIEDADASSYTVHLICHDLREEQVQVLQDTQKKYAKKYDGAYEIVYVEARHRTYDTLYTVGIRLKTYKNSFYKSDIIICYNSFMQNYSACLLEPTGASIETTPLYYRDATYKFSTFLYHMVDSMKLKTSADTVPTVLGTEAPYIEKSLLGIDPERVSETTVRHAKMMTATLLGGLLVVTLAVWLEFEKMRYPFAIFAAFGADTKRLRQFLAYKLLVITIGVQIPCLLLTYGIGACLYGKKVLALLPHRFLLTFFIMCMVVLWSAWIVTAHMNHKTVVQKLSSEDNSMLIHSPRVSHVFAHRDTFWKEYTIVNILRHGKFYGIACMVVVLFVGTAVFLSYQSRETSLPAQFTLSFPEMMEYEIWEESLAPALTQIEGIAVDAELSQTIVSAEQGSAGLCVWCGDTLLAKCTIVAGGEGVYSRYPQIRTVLENGQAVYVGESCTGDTLIYKKEEETISCPVGLYIPEKNTVPTVYVPYAVYQMLFGEIHGETLSRHMVLPEKANVDDSLSVCTYKSKAYTEDYTLRCGYTFSEAEEVLGDPSELLVGQNNVVLRCSAATWEKLNYSLGDKIQLSDTGRKKSWATEENAVELSARLATTSYHYDRYTIVAVVFADIPAIELWSGPMLYRELTGIEMAYSSADLLWTATTSPENVWKTLRQITGQYYEVYLTDNHTYRIQTLRETYHRGMERNGIRLCLSFCMVLIVVEWLWIVDTRRNTEKKILKMVTPNWTTARVGMYIPAAGLTLMGLVLCCLV